jgi:hypothetical protein
VRINNEELVLGVMKKCAEKQGSDGGFSHSTFSGHGYN